MASSSSRWPEPAIPAIPKISPDFAVNETLSSTLTFSRFVQLRPATISLSAVSCGSLRSMLSSIFLPTIISVRALSSVSLVETVPIYSPFLRTDTRSDISITSLSLWVMIMMDLPSSFIRRRTAKSRCVSCGVSTAVGSSRMSISAPR